MAFTPEHFSAQRVTQRRPGMTYSEDVTVFRLVGSVFPPIVGAREGILGNGVAVQETKQDVPRQTTATVWAEGDKASGQPSIVALEYHSPHAPSAERSTAIGELLLAHGDAIGAAAEGAFSPLEHRRGAETLPLPQRAEVAA